MVEIMKDIERIIEHHNKMGGFKITTKIHREVISEAIEQFVIKARIEELEAIVYFMEDKNPARKSILKRIAELKKGLEPKIDDEPMWKYMKRHSDKAKVELKKGLK